MTKMDGIYCIDGDGRHDDMVELDALRHLEIPDLNQDELPLQGVAVLNLSGKALQGLLGAFFRQKRPFALLDVEDMDDAQLERLAATAKKRKSPCWLLGALRVLPLVAAVKEVITGGCVGCVTALTLELGGAVTGQVQTVGSGRMRGLLVADTASWLLEGAPVQAPSLRVSTDAEHGELRIVCTGTAGRLEGAYDFARRSGELASVINGHIRTRRFGEADTRGMELGLLASLGMKGRDVPGLMPLRSIGIAEKMPK